jgi:peptidoglycan/xylan/chitin deacetylase (PgdA/CDA1 family)
MEPVSELRQREAEAYFRMVAARGPDADVPGYAFHNLGVYDEGDFETLSDVLVGADAGASFAFLGRDADEQAGVVESMDAAGHDVVLHGHRHVACADLPASLARDNVERGLAAVEAASGVTPAGFFAPLQTMNAETMDALVDAGFGWAVGHAEVAVPDGLTVVEIEPLVDFELLTDGTDPAEAFDALGTRAEEGGVFLVHPNVVEFYDGTAELEAWIDEHRPRPVSEWIEEGGVGLLVDAVRPLRIE